MKAINIDIKANKSACYFCIHRPYQDEIDFDHMDKCPLYLEQARDENKREYEWMHHDSPGEGNCAMNGDEDDHTPIAETEPRWKCGNFVHRDERKKRNYQPALWNKLTNSMKDKDILSVCEALIGGVALPKEYVEDKWVITKKIMTLIKVWGWKDNIISQIKIEKPQYGTILSDIIYKWREHKIKVNPLSANEFLPEDLQDMNKGQLPADFDSIMLDEISTIDWKNAHLATYTQQPGVPKDLLKDFKINNLVSDDEIEMLTNHFKSL